MARVKRPMKIRRVPLSSTKRPSERPESLPGALSGLRLSRPPVLSSPAPFRSGERRCRRIDCLSLAGESQPRFYAPGAMYLLLKAVVPGLSVAAASEIARRSSLLGAILISLPLTSILAATWLCRDTRDTEQVAALSWSILWVIVPSLVFSWCCRSRFGGE